MSTSTAQSADALRAYSRTLRQGRKITQPDLADAIGMNLRTYKSWEMGDTKDIKTPYLLRAVRVLCGSFEQVANIQDAATAEEGAALARAWIKAPVEAIVEEARSSPDDVAARLNRFLELLAMGVDSEAAARAMLPTH